MIKWELERFGHFGQRKGKKLENGLTVGRVNDAITYNDPIWNFGHLLKAQGYLCRALGHLLNTPRYIGLTHKLFTQTQIF